MSSHFGRRVVSTAVVAAALAAALASGGGTAVAGSLAPIENVIQSGSEASGSIVDVIGSSDTVTTASDEVVSPVLIGGLDVIDTVCTAVRTLVFGQHYCLVPPIDPGRG